MEGNFTGYVTRCQFNKFTESKCQLNKSSLIFLSGFSVGDELGLAESLGNLEGNKRRSLSQRDSLSVNNIGVFPAAKLTVN